jgi:putative DNA methylase
MLNPVSTFRGELHIAPLDAFSTRALIDEARLALRTATLDQLPTVVDPFCGGGSTIVEAQRLGFQTIASDLNPIPVLITTALCRIPQLFRCQGAVNPSARTGRAMPAQGLAGLAIDVRHYARQIRDRAWQRLAPFYPAQPAGTEVFAWRWAWAVPSPNPAAQAALTPLVTDWSLSRSKREKAWVVPHCEGRRITFSIATNGTPPRPTAGKNSARCLFTGAPIPFEYLRAEASKGRLLPKMFALIAAQGKQRTFIVPSERDVDPALDVDGLEVPDVALPEKALGFRVQAYGIKRFSDLFLPRQVRSLITFADLASQIHAEIVDDACNAGMNPDPRPLEDGGSGARAYADGIAAILGLCVGRLAASNNILVQWFIDPRSGGGKGTPAFRMQTISMVWDFVETNPFADSVGGWCGPVVESALNAFGLVEEDAPPAHVSQLDARNVAEVVPAGSLVATDPPYYANIGYADLADFFYIWLRRSLRTAFPKLMGTVASPKSAELIAAPYRHEGRESVANDYFRSGFRDVFRSLSRRVGPSYPMSIIYAVKQQEGKGSRRLTGWEVFLEGIIEAGLVISATWPIRTTTLTRTRGLRSNALASAICIVCRPKPKDAGRVSRREFLGQLHQELQEALGQLRAANIAPVDFAQAAVGRGMAVFSKHESVVESGGNSLSVGVALGIINQVVDEILAQQESDFDAGSRWALAWFEQSAFAEGEFGIAETLSRAKNTSVSALVEAGMVASRAGKVRLVKREELTASWDPVTERRLTCWGATQRLISMLERQGEGRAAELINKLGGLAETCRDLAYRLYTICERKKWAEEALAYNGLVLAWPELTKLALAERSRTAEPAQGEMFS